MASTLDADRIMPLNGTREGLFNACLALCPETKRGKRPVVLMPNPFYQPYAAAVAAVGAEPVFVPATAATGFLPDYAALPADILDRTALAYLCSPANPQGSVAPRDYLADVMALAERHGFTLLSDECYSEIWRTAPPTGALSVAAELGADPERVAVFHSLSKRSNLPGLRSGFVAGGPESIARFRQLRAYGGAPLPLPVQHVSQAAWADEAHVDANRALYQEKYRIADAVFAGMQGYQGPEGGFFLWLPVPNGTSEDAALKLWTQTGVRVLPGAYLGQTVGGENPGDGYIRVAMVAPARRHAARPDPAPRLPLRVKDRVNMASYQARQRDPLLDQTMQAAIERRGKELLGAVLILLGLLTALMLASYSPDDPSWLAATEEPAQNWLGTFGASLASPLYVIAGYGSWGVALVFAVWGFRFLTHRGEERAIGRAIFAPIAVALISVYASTLVAGPGWVHSFGLGGLFGDTILGALLGVVPVQAAFGLKVLSLIVGCRHARHAGLRPWLRPHRTARHPAVPDRRLNPDL